MTRILLLGGTRYLGKSIADLLVSDDEVEILIVSRSNDSHFGNVVIGDRRDLDLLRAIVSGFNPHVVIDMVNFQEVDSQVVAQVFEEREDLALRHYLFVSTFFVYNYFPWEIFRESLLNTDGLGRVNDNYTSGKVASELYLYWTKLYACTTVLRLPFVFSADDYTQRFPRVCELEFKPEVLSLANDARFSMIRKFDAAKAIVKIAMEAPLGIVDLSNKGTVSSRDLVQISDGFAEKRNLPRTLCDTAFPYSVNLDIGLCSTKFTVEADLYDAISIEMEAFWSHEKLWSPLNK